MLTTAISFIFWRSSVMHSTSNNIKFTFYNGSNEIVDGRLESLCLIYQVTLEISMRWSDFIFDSVQLMYCKCHKVSLRRGGSYIYSLERIKKKKTTINSKNTDDKWFQYTSTVALNYEETKWNPERISNIKPFINKYNWTEINYPSKIDDWKTFEKNNETTALNILYIKKKKK